MTVILKDVETSLAGRLSASLGTYLNISWKY